MKLFEERKRVLQDPLQDLTQQSEENVAQKRQCIYDNVENTEIAITVNSNSSILIYILKDLVLLKCRFYRFIQQIACHHRIVQWNEIFDYVRQINAFLFVHHTNNILAFW